MRRLRGTLVVLGTLLLAGCASIPSSGAVQSGIELGDTSTIELDILARGPQAGDTPEQILEGFLAASASPQLDFRIAREFLTPDFSKDWKPDSGTTVDQSGERSTTQLAEGNLSLRIQPVATVGDDGQYSAAPAASAETRNYQLQKISGEWRISAAPQGIIIDQATFGIVFGAYPLQFFSPDGLALVPDVRWFARRETTQTAIVRALLAGPSSWLESGVVSAFPTGTRLDADSVPVSGATATISLAVDAIPTSESLSRMQSQFVSSLSAVSGITSVSIAINGTVENVSPLLPAPSTELRVDARPLVYADGTLGFVSGVSNEVQALPGLSAQLAELSPNAIALGPNGAVAAVRSIGGIYRVATGSSQLVVSGSDWMAPSIDRFDGIWTARNSNRVTWEGTDGGTAEFVTGWGDAALRSVTVSRDGSRIAAVLQTGSVSRLVVSAIARGGDGSPTNLGSPLLVAEFDGNATAMNWADSRTVAVLLAGEGTSSVLTAVVGGQSSRIDAPIGATYLSVGNGIRELRVLDGDGQVLQSSGSIWQLRKTGVQVLATQLGVD
ncbi:MAG: LpqB family beta-propeller domain-containing protein [Agromyces sp.]